MTFDDPTILAQAAALIASLATAIATFVAWRFFNIKLDDKRQKDFAEGVLNAVRWLIARYGSAEEAQSHVFEGVRYIQEGKPQAYNHFGDEAEVFAHRRITALLSDATKATETT